MSNETTSGSPSETGTVTLRLDAETLAALDLWVVDHAEGLSRVDAVHEALRDWLIGHGYLKFREDPEMAN